MPVCSLLACQTAGLEAAMYFRANENAIARNYFNGVRKMMYLTEQRLGGFKRRFLETYEVLVVESAMRSYWNWYRKVKVEILIEMCFFELKCEDYDVADELIVEIHETLQEINPSGYMINEVMNLGTCSAQLRRVIKKPEVELEIEFENLNLSPVSYSQPPRTPVTKLTKPPKLAKNIVKDEEIPKKRKVIKLNLDEASDEKEVKAAKPDFKHVLEAATPRTRTKPIVLLTQPSEETDPPKRDTTLRSTPKDSTPDQFFTPMSSVKTYPKKSLRHNIVKNLEQEFSVDKDNKTSSTRGASLQVPYRSKSRYKKTLI